MLKLKQYAQFLALVIAILLFFNLLTANLGQVQERIVPNPVISLVENKDYRITSENETAEYCVIAGEDSKSDIYKMLDLTFQNLHKTFRVYKTLDDIPSDNLSEIKAIFLIPNTMQAIGNESILLDYVEHGGAAVFMQMIEEKNMTSQIKELMGLRSVGGVREQNGLRIMEHFLIGGMGEFEYDGLYAMDASIDPYTKVFAAEYDPENRSEPSTNPLIWRNYSNGGFVYVFNGDFFHDISTIGLLVGVLADISDSFIYPIVDASVLSLLNLSVMTEVNQETMQELYSRMSSTAFRDLVWPTIISISLKNGLDINMFMVPGLEDFPSDQYPKQADINFWMKESRTATAVVGLNGYGTNSFDQEKTMDFVDFMHEATDDFEFHVLAIPSHEIKNATDFLEKNPSIATIIPTDIVDFPQFDYIPNKQIILPAFSTGLALEDTDFFGIQSIASALGIVHHTIDFTQFYNPQTIEDEWTAFSESLESTIHGYMLVNDWVSPVNLLDATEKVRLYLSSEPQITETDTVITVTNEYSGLSFILRTYSDIESVTGGTLEVLEEGAYKLTMLTKEMKITLKE